MSKLHLYRNLLQPKFLDELVKTASACSWADGPFGAYEKSETVIRIQNAEALCQIDAFFQRNGTCWGSMADVTNTFIQLPADSEIEEHIDSHDGFNDHQIMVVLSGRANYRIDEDYDYLSPGDGVYYESTARRHAFTPTGDTLLLSVGYALPIRYDG